MNERNDSESHRTDPKVYFGEHIPRKLKERAALRERFSGVQTTAVVEVTGTGGGVWHIIIDGSDIQVREGHPQNSVFGVEVSIETFRQLRNKSVSPQNAFLRGKIKLSGSVTTAMKLAALLK